MQPSEIDMELMARGLRALPRNHDIHLQGGKVDLATIDQKHIQGLQVDRLICSLSDSFTETCRLPIYRVCQTQFEVF